eukprot:TRINITY_DN1473_c0_g1_i1.p1 TRINITY_DN1473_c0_g1~~TRINITY_DN1473_c0_g1_i1.p1  ORF type:complete len:140 (+),score=9.37 TRINITY_DN1473_c0_g1_i1:276-695(+)
MNTTAVLKRMIQGSPLENYTPEMIEWRSEYNNIDIVESVFNHVDAIVVPSIWDENSPLVIQEAQQLKIPVITSEKGGMGELVQNGVNGLTFRHKNVESLAKTLQYALNQPQKMRNLGNRVIYIVQIIKFHQLISIFWIL